MRALALTLLLLASPAAPAAAEERGVAFEIAQNLVFLPARINGSPPLSFILDSGASLLVVDPRHRAGLGLAPGTRSTVAALGGPVEVEIAGGAALEAGGAALPPEAAALIPLARIEPKLGRSVDGIIGGALFRRHVVEIDYRARRLRLHDRRSFRYSGPGRAVPIEIEGSRPFARLRLQMGSGPPVEGRFLVDTGAISSLYLNPSFAGRHGLPGSDVPVAPELFTEQLGGQVPGRIARADRVELGGFAMEGALVHFIDDTSAGGTAATTQDGLIGAELLRRFTIFFDYSRGRMYLEPNEDFAAPFLHDLSGLELVSDGPAFSSLRVRTLLDGSAAAAAGLRAGDLVTAVDGNPTPGSALDRVESMLTEPGRRLRLEVSRGGARLTVLLELPERPAI